MMEKQQSFYCYLLWFWFNQTTRRSRGTMARKHLDCEHREFVRNILEFQPGKKLQIFRWWPSSLLLPWPGCSGSPVLLNRTAALGKEGTSFPILSTCSQKRKAGNGAWMDYPGSSLACLESESQLPLVKLSFPRNQICMKVHLNLIWTLRVPSPLVQNNSVINLSLAWSMLFLYGLQRHYPIC